MAISVIIGGQVPSTLGPSMNLHFDIAKRDALLSELIGVDNLEHAVARSSMRASADAPGVLGDDVYPNTISLGVKKWEDDLAEVSQVSITGKYMTNIGEQTLTPQQVAEAFVTVSDVGLVGNWITCTRADVTEWEAESLANWQYDGRKTYAVSFYSLPPKYDSDQLFYCKIIPIYELQGQWHESSKAHTIIVDFRGTFRYLIGDRPIIIKDCDPIAWQREHRVELHRYRHTLYLKTTFTGALEVKTEGAYPIWDEDVQSEPYAKIKMGFKRGGISGARVQKAEYYEEGTAYTEWLPFPANYGYGSPQPNPTVRYWDSVKDPAYGPPGTSVTITPQTTNINGRPHYRLRIHMISSSRRATPCILSASTKFEHQASSASAMVQDVTQYVYAMTRIASLDNHKKQLSVTLRNVPRNGYFDKIALLCGKPISVYLDGQTFFKGVIRDAKIEWPAKNVFGITLHCEDYWCYLEEASIGSRELNGMTIREAMQEILRDAGLGHVSQQFVGPEYDVLIPETFQRSSHKTRSGMKFSEILDQINRIWCPQNIMGFTWDGTFYARRRPGCLDPPDTATNADHPDVARIFCYCHWAWEGIPPEWATPINYPYYVMNTDEGEATIEGFFNDFWVIGRDADTFRPIISRYLDYNSISNGSYPYFTGHRKWYAVYNTAVVSIQQANFIVRKLARLLGTYYQSTRIESAYDPLLEPGDLVVIRDALRREAWPWRIVGMEVRFSRQGPYESDKGHFGPEYCIYNLEYERELGVGWDPSVPGVI